jgi:hypothetical protein
MKASHHKLLESERVLGEAADLLLGIHRAMVNGPSRRLFVEDALGRLRPLAASGGALESLVSRGTDGLYRAPEVAMDAIVVALEEVNQARTTTCSRILSR